MALAGGASKPAFLQGASNLNAAPSSSMAAKQNLLGAMTAQSKPAAGGGFVYGGASQGGATSLFGAASAA